MATKFGRVESSETNFVEQIFHKNQTLNSASNGVNHVLAKRITNLTHNGFGKRKFLIKKYG